MTENRFQAVVPQGAGSLSSASRLAERTLAERVEREEQALVATRTLVVGPGGYVTISEAVDAARDGDTVLVRPGRYEESVVVEGKAITIRGDGQRDTIVVGWDEGPAFTLVKTDSMLSGLTIVGGGPPPESNPRPESKTRGSRVAALRAAAALRVTAGGPQLDALELIRGGGIWFEGGAAGALVHSQINGNSIGINVCEGASPRIEENDVSAKANTGIVITGAGSNPLIRTNRVHDCKGFGIAAFDGASPRIEENQIWANHGAQIMISEAGSPTLTGNTVRDGQGEGIVVVGPTSPTIVDNTITGNAILNIHVYKNATPTLGPNVVGPLTADRTKKLVPKDLANLAPASRLAGRTLVVGPGAYATIGAAVEAALDGYTVLVRPGRYRESVVVKGKTITIRGDGERDAIVVGWDKGPAFTLVETRSTLSGLTIVGGRPRSESRDGAGLQVTGGAPQLLGLRVMQGRGILFEGAAAGVIQHSQIDANDYGVAALEGSSPRIEGNEVWGNEDGGIVVLDSGSDPLVRANQVHDGRHAGILVGRGASPRIEGNEIYANANIGIGVMGTGTDPLITANRIHDGREKGVAVFNGASPRIEGNEVWGNAYVGIGVAGAGTDPLITANRIHDGLDGGIDVLDGASPTITGNTITGNAREAIRVVDAHPKIGQNVVSP